MQIERFTQADSRAVEGPGWGRWLTGVVVALGLAVALTGCGGGSDEEPATAAVTIDARGGTVREASGATVIVPAGAIQTETTIRVAMDSTGAPPWGSSLASGDVYAFTPHGANFDKPVEVRVPIPQGLRGAGETLAIAQAEAGGSGWTILDGVVRDGDALVVKVTGFSFFRVVDRRLGLLAPFRVDAQILSCEPGQLVFAGSCITLTHTTLTLRVQTSGVAITGCDLRLPVLLSAIAYPLRNTNSLLPSSRVDRVVLIDRRDVRDVSGALPPGGARPLLAQTIDANATLVPWVDHFGAVVEMTTECAVMDSAGRVSLLTERWPGAIVGFGALLDEGPLTNINGVYFQPLHWVQHPEAPVGVEGQPLTLTAVLTGGASLGNPPTGLNPFDARPATALDSATVDWERSDDNGRSWRTIARSWEHEADPNPFRSGQDWRYWGIRHGLSAVTRGDAGALYRGRACYAMPGKAQAQACTTSRSARLTLAAVGEAPAFSSISTSQLVRAGQTASFTVAASGLPTPTLQWQTRPANSSGAWTNVATGNGATTANYTTPVLSTANNGTQYRVVASNALGSAESAAVTVSVSDLDVAPTITTQPAGLSVTVGNDAAFAIAARGTEALSYQWRKDGVAITGANSPVLRLPAVNAGQAGAYSVTVSNAAGTVASNVAALTVSAGAPADVAPTIVTQPVSVRVNAGNTATFAVGASGSGSLSYQWLRNGQPIAGAKAAFHSIASAAVDDAATYAVQVSNGVGPGVKSADAVLTVDAGPQLAALALTTQPSPQVQAPGAGATFAVAATGSAPISYQWLKNGAPVGGATSAVLTLSNLTGGDAGAYSVAVTNPLGSVTSDTASLSILGAPVIGTQPLAASAREGSTASFSTTASGSSLRYQWTRNSIAITGATSASYTTPALTLADSGAVYGVVVYNGAGVTISQGAVLTVTPVVAVAKAWGQAGPIEGDKEDIGDATRARVATDASGNLIVVWQQADRTRTNIWAKRYSATSQTWGVPTLIETNDAGNASGPQIAILGNGDAIAVWYQDDGSSRFDIWANRYDAATNSWGTATLLEASTATARFPQIASDSSGNALAVWSQCAAGTCSVWANRYSTGTGWGTAARIESGSTNSAGGAQIAIDASGNALAVWNRFDGGSRNDIWANRYTAATNSWGTAVLIESGNAGTAEAPQVAIDANGNGVAAWAYFDGIRFDIMATRYTAATDTWGPAALSLTAAAGSGSGVQVAFDVAGNAIAVWTQQDGTHYDIWANRYTAATGWGTATLIERDNAGNADQPAIAFDEGGNALAVWHQSDGTRFNVWANRYTAGTGWGAAALLETDNVGDAVRPHIAIDGNGNGFAVWDQSSGVRIDIWGSLFR